MCPAHQKWLVSLTGAMLADRINSIGDHRQALVGQFTNDDYKEVILANIDCGIQLFTGLKDGFFEQPIAIAGTEISARSLAKGDLDQDGDLDVVVGGDEQPNITLYNKGNELFEAVLLTKEADDTC